MKIRPVKIYKKPEYPNISEFSKNASDLSKRSPRRWKKNAAIGALLLSFAVSTNCGSKLPDTPKSRLDLMKEIASDSSKSKVDTNFIAPIFEHGKGIGAFGCDVVMPPVFISEQDVKNIINNEFNKYGILLDTINQESSISVKTIKLKDKYFDSKNNAFYDTNKITFDLNSKELDLHVIFVSSAKYNKFADQAVNNISVYDENYLNFAKHLREIIKREGGYNVAIFYDPMPQISYKLLKSIYSEGKKDDYFQTMASDSLRAQVRDYVKWLKEKR